jgi:hypothetical protein
MDSNARKALVAAGFRVGDAADFLGLTDDERRLVELRLELSRRIRELRADQRLTQQQLASKLKTSQPRVAKMEAGSPGVSLEQLVRGYFLLGGSLAPSGAKAKVKAKAGPGKAKAVAAVKGAAKKARGLVPGR